MNYVVTIMCAAKFMCAVNLSAQDAPRSWKYSVASCGEAPDSSRIVPLSTCPQTPRSDYGEYGTYQAVKARIWLGFQVKVLDNV